MIPNFSKSEALKVIKEFHEGNKFAINLATANKWVNRIVYFKDHTDRHCINETPEQYLINSGFRQDKDFLFNPQQQSNVLVIVGEEEINDPLNYYLSRQCFLTYCLIDGLSKGKSIKIQYERIEEEFEASLRSSEIVNIKTSDDFLRFLQKEIMSNGNVSSRGVARCCGVASSSFSQKHLKLSDTGKYSKLAQRLIQKGSHPDTLIKDGFPPDAVWLCIEYYAWDSGADAPIAKQIARTVGTVGVITALKGLTQQSSNSDTLLAQIVQQNGQMVQQNQMFLADLTNKLHGNEVRVNQANQNATEAINTATEVKTEVKEVKQEVTNVQEVVQEQAKKVEKTVKFADAYTCDEGYDRVSEHLKTFAGVSFHDKVSNCLGMYMGNKHNGFTKNTRKVKVDGARPQSQWVIDEFPQAICEIILLRKIVGYKNPSNPNDNIQIKLSKEVLVMPSVLDKKRTTLKPYELIAKLYPAYTNRQSLEALIPQQRLYEKEDKGDKYADELNELFMKARTARQEAKKKSPKAS